jgi:hypothetical protein
MDQEYLSENPLSWDMTKLAGPVKGKYFDAYVMIDIYSRHIVGAVVHAHESGPLAAEMMKEIFGVHEVPQVVHVTRSARDEGPEAGTVTGAAQRAGGSS